ncbi:Rv3212 family protein [Corynebacterium sanguinis]|uniref:Uncharacterized protein n=1 Tax=Corynebacterium sanguinis TaxID=2594913 RepID=A0A6C1U189_9CORY|nr:hypothetical protein [Corynebacterium sanguinis]MBA4505020.1 hypothetical protein [Corynebacterium sanguinis]MCT1462864.1 hypothetical protein [Corynebacterium sanguinis]MCT1499542.1 hypothetical protein [Corynebacterium sanguinis]MCT1554715.1 hypothetical protein [Corynebacterium sanguinis]MCT2329348.1 hypothetical protein [Corynebacterium sanguinis]
MSAPYRRTRGDLIASAVIAVVSLVLVAAAFLTAPIRASQLSPAEKQYESAARLSTPPTTLQESFRLPDTSPGVSPVIAEGMIISYADGTLRATTPQGETAWTYQRDLELCTLDQAWGKVIATYRGNAGCGDVVALDALAGTYSATRSSVAPDEVASLSSNDRVGYVSSERVELWRSDLVRTVEYGRVEAPQESEMQPHACGITSALTRKELLAVTERCDDGTWLRLQTTTPEDSRKPEIEANVSIAESAYLVAVSPEVAAVYNPGSREVRAYNTGGEEVSASPAPDFGPAPDSATHEAADLPHHMTYFAPNTLGLFEPDSLRFSGEFEGALGPGVAAGDRLLFATDQGVAVANWDTREVERVISIDRSGYTGTVGVAGAGGVVVEKRGGELVVFSAN